MFKKIREEKTFGKQKKSDIKEALNSLDAVEEKKGEQEDQWIEELMERKLKEAEQEAFLKEEEKTMLADNYNSVPVNVKEEKMKADAKNYSSLPQ